MFEVGERIVYPLHGLAIVKKIVEKEVEDESLKYYVIEIPREELMVKVPIKNAEGIGIRKVISSDEVAGVFKIFLKGKSKMAKNWNRRFKRNIERMKTNDITKIAEVVRDLSLKKKDSGLSIREKRMLEKAKGILISEIACAQDINEKEALSEVESYFI